MRIEDFGDKCFWALVVAMVGVGAAAGLLVYLFAVAIVGVIGATAMAVFIGAAIAWGLFLLLMRAMLP